MRYIDNAGLKSSTTLARIWGRSVDHTTMDKVDWLMGRGWWNAVVAPRHSMHCVTVVVAAAIAITAAIDLRPCSGARIMRFVVARTIATCTVCRVTTRRNTVLRLVVDLHLGSVIDQD